MGDGGKGDARRAMLVSAEEYARNYARTFERKECGACEGRGTWVEMRCARLHRTSWCPECVEEEVSCEECGGTGKIEG